MQKIFADQIVVQTTIKYG